MFRRITALFFLMAFVSQTFSAPFMLADYYINTAAYAKNCINKARPMLHCNGKCQVMKKIREEEKQQQENAERFGNLKTEVLSTKSFYPALLTPQSITVTTVKPSVHNSERAIKMPRSFFHPPDIRS